MDGFLDLDWFSSDIGSVFKGWALDVFHLDVDLVTSWTWIGFI